MIRLRDELEGFAPYRVPAQTAPVKLNTNECPLSPPPSVAAAIKGAAAGLSFNRYPDPVATDLRGAIAEAYGLTPAAVAIGNGSNEIVRHLLMAFGGPARRIALYPPSYQVYSVAARALGTKMVDIPREADFTVGRAAVASAGAADADLHFVCNPNNPTGTLTGRKTLLDMAEAIGEDSLLVVDEAYAEFSGEESVSLLEAAPNIALVRTFSKAYGLAGLRVGYILAHPQVVECVESVQLPYHVNALSQAAACAAITHRDEYLPLIASLRAERERICEAIAEMPGAMVHPTASNFILFDTAQPAATVYDSLLEDGVLVRTYPGVAGFEKSVRVTVGTRAENDIFLGALEDTLSS